MKDVAKLALGTAQFGLNYGISNINGQCDKTDVKMILDAAWAHGLKVLDTAMMYGNSEACLGETNTHEFKIVTKFPAEINQRCLRSVLNNSLESLCVNSLYGYIAHDSESLIRQPGLWRILKELREDSLVEKIGYSLYTLEQLDVLLSMDCVPDIVQLPYSFIDRRFEDRFKELKKLGVEIHCRSVFLQGLLLMKSAEFKNVFFDPVIPVLNQLSNTFESVTVLAAALMKWVINKPEIDYLVFGINDVKQLEGNLKNLIDAKTNQLDMIVLPEVPVDILLPYKWPDNN